VDEVVEEVVGVVVVDGGVAGGVVVAGIVVVVVVVEEVVEEVVVASMIVRPNELTCRTVHDARVLYPETVRWTPSAMNRDVPFGTNWPAQSAT
jgi:hypothetical protein